MQCFQVFVMDIKQLEIYNTVRCYRDFALSDTSFWSSVADSTQIDYVAILAADCNQFISTNFQPVSNKINQVEADNRWHELIARIAPVCSQ